MCGRLLLRRFFKGVLKVNKKRLIIPGITAAAVFVFCGWQNNMLTISRYSYVSAEISEEFDGFKIVQISDLHNKRFGKNQRRLLKKTADLEPDIIVITGDIVDSNHTDIDKALEFAEGAAEIAPTYYITGNHEHWLEDDEFESLLAGLRESGVKILDDERTDVEKDGGHFSLIGIDDLSLGRNTLNNMNLNANEFNVLLAHEPQYIAKYSVANVDLALTGHAHGGQFRLPFIGGVVAPDQGFFPEYTEGSHTSGGMTMIISRGLGNSVIPVRLFNFPEIVSVELNCPKL